MHFRNRFLPKVKLTFEKMLTCFLNANIRITTFHATCSWIKMGSFMLVYLEKIKSFPKRNMMYLKIAQHETDRCGFIHRCFLFLLKASLFFILGPVCTLTLHANKFFAIEFNTIVLLLVVLSSVCVFEKAKREREIDTIYF